VNDGIQYAKGPMTEYASAPDDPASFNIDNPPVLPEFELAVFDEGGDGAALEIGVMKAPSILRHASPALLYGLAIMTLDQQGTIKAMVDTLLADGPINEIDATNRITLLLEQDANVEPV
jgi:hypothetical protein